MSLERRFIRAIAFCLTRDGYGGDAEALARWALGGEVPEPPPAEKRLKVALVSGGAVRIKGYVFESARLPEIRGASALLDRVNREDIPRLWGLEDGGGIGCEECVIYANGGEVLAFAPVTRAAWLADEIEHIYTRETLVAQSVAVWQEFELDQIRNGLFHGRDVDPAAARRLLGYRPDDPTAFGSLVAPLALANRRRREGNADGGRAPRPYAHFETVPFARRCSSCERRGAVVNARVGGGADDDRPLCEPCARKRVFGQMMKRESADLNWWQFNWEPVPKGQEARSWTAQFVRFLDERPNLKEQYAADEEGKSVDLGGLEAVRDLGEIAQASQPRGFIGFIYADGNNMGRLLETLKTPVEYRVFAGEVFRAIQEATFAALARGLRPAKVTRERRPGQVHVHPFEILGIGGDDLLLIVPAHVALTVACDIAEGVEQDLIKASPLFGRDETYTWAEVQRCRGGDTGRQCRVSLSAGVVIADAHTPIFYLEQLAAQLLDSAKSRAKWLARKKYFSGTVDFLSLKSVSALSGTVEQFREATLTVGRRHLYARPYTIAEVHTLVNTITLLKKVGFPRSQLYRLRDSLRAGSLPSTVDYRYFLSRDDRTKGARLEIEQEWPQAGASALHTPWREQRERKGALETIWHDVAELYDFVSAETEYDDRGQN